MCKYHTDDIPTSGCHHGLSECFHGHWGVLTGKDKNSVSLTEKIWHMAFLHHPCDTARTGSGYESSCTSIHSPFCLATKLLGSLGCKPVYLVQRVGWSDQAHSSSYYHDGIITAKLYSHDGIMLEHCLLGGFNMHAPEAGAAQDFLASMTTISLS